MARGIVAFGATNATMPPAILPYNKIYNTICFISYIDWNRNSTVIEFISHVCHKCHNAPCHFAI